MKKQSKKFKGSAIEMDDSYTPQNMTLREGDLSVTLSMRDQETISITTSKGSDIIAQMRIPYYMRAAIGQMMLLGLNGRSAFEE